MKVLFTLLGRIGDMVLLTPTIHRLKTAYPEAEIDVIASRHNFMILDNNPSIHEVMIFNKLPWKIWALKNKIKATKYNYYFDVKDHFSSESNMIASWVDAETKIGYAKDKNSVFDTNISNLFEVSRTHYAHKSQVVLKSMGIFPDLQILPKLYTNSQEKQFAIQNIDRAIGQVLNNDDGKINSKKILINLSASSPIRIWSKEKFLELINHIISLNYFVYVIFTKEQKEDFEFMSKSCSNSKMISHVETKSIREVIALVEQMDLIISPDTSIVHISSAFDKALIGLYGNLEANFNKFYPLNKVKEICKAKASDESLDTIDSTTVIKAFDSLITKV
jgi:ADP-heptose:LPS heptosyltransferase